MKIFNVFKKIGQKNGIMKPASVLTQASLPLAYLLPKVNMGAIPDVDSELMLVSKEFMASFQGAIILLIMIISLVQVYKPSKVIIVTLVVGGLMLFASALFEMLGMALLLYGGGTLINNVTINKLIIRNNKLSEKKQEMDIDNIIQGVK